MVIKGKRDVVEVKVGARRISDRVEADQGIAQMVRVSSHCEAARFWRSCSIGRGV